MTIKKFALSFFVFAFMFATVLSIAPRSASAAPVFPIGCASAIGYSVTNGTPCNGQSNATMILPGCNTPMGYSTMNGIPCSGASEAISYLSGCSSMFGYSTANGAPCNGTTVATIYTDPYTTPGLPTTGTGGMTATNATLLALSLILLSVGVVYSTRRTKIA